MVEFHFGPASPHEQVVYGAKQPSTSPQGVSEWTRFMQANGIARVCCLLDSNQLKSFGFDLFEAYRERFGPFNVCPASIRDHHLCDPETLHRRIMPFLQESNAKRLRVVVHCWGGNGRTGQILAAWLVAARAHSPMEAIAVVESMGRKPREAVEAGNATHEEVLALLDSCAPKRAT